MSQSVLVTFVVAAFLGSACAFKLEGHYKKEGTYVFYDIKNQLTLKCTADEPTDIAWYKNDTKVQDIADLNERYEITTGDGKRESTFKIARALQHDQGAYSCRAKDQKQHFTAAGNVLVKVPSNTNTVEGEKLRLHCNAVGSQVSIVWSLPDNSTIDETNDHHDPRYDNF